MPIHQINMHSDLNFQSHKYHLGMTDFYQSCPKHIMQSFLNSLDVYNRTAYVANQELLGVVTTILKNGGDNSVGIPATNLSWRSFIGSEKGFSTGDFRSKLAKEELSLVEGLMVALDQLNDLGDREYFMPCSIDYRGRLYPMATFVSHLNNDSVRACHKFATKKKLGPRPSENEYSGFEWLIIHCMNCAEILKKPTREESLEIGKKLLPCMIESARDPINGAGWWKTVESPFQTLAACMEIRDALDSGDVENFESNLPVYQDGTCNGYQHWSAIGRDITGAIASNVCPNEENDRPQDLYTAILKHVVRDLNENDNGQMHYKEALRVINRKLVKRPVMTIPYGVTKRGAHIQVLEEVKPLIRPEYQNDVSELISLTTLRAVDEVFGAAMGLKGWLCEMAKCEAVYGRQMAWISPLGLPCSQIAIDRLTRSKVERDKLKQIDHMRQSLRYGNVRTNFKPSNIPVSTIKAHMAIGTWGYLL